MDRYIFVIEEDSKWACGDSSRVTKYFLYRWRGPRWIYPGVLYFFHCAITFPFYFQERWWLFRLSIHSRGYTKYAVDYTRCHPPLTVCLPDSRSRNPIRVFVERTAGVREDVMVLRYSWNWPSLTHIISIQLHEDVLKASSVICACSLTINLLDPHWSPKSFWTRLSTESFDGSIRKYLWVWRGDERKEVQTVRMVFRWYF